MTDLQKQAMRMALERLESHEYWMDERAIQALRQALAQENFTKTVRFDLSPAMVEGEIHNKLIDLGWTPPNAGKSKQENEALAQPEQDPEPRGHCTCGDPTLLGYVHFRTRPCIYYAAPPKREWQGLTSDDKVQIHTMWVLNGRFEECLDATEAKLKDKNT